MQHFVRDDLGYLAGSPSIRPTRDQHVLEAVSQLSEDSPATCPSISGLQQAATIFTAGDYSKLWGDRTELEQQARHFGGIAQATCTQCF
jgi:hypothetical protein